MLNYLTLDDSTGAAVTLHETGKRALSSVKGLIGISAVRASTRDRPTAHGGIDETHWTGAKLVDVQGEVWSTVGQVDAYAEFRLIEAPMLQTLDVGPALMKWQEGPDGLQLQRRVALASEVEPVLEEGAAFLKYQAQFYGEDPRAYSQTLETVTSAALSATTGGMVFPLIFPFTFAAGGGATAAVTNAGNRPTPPMFRIHGGCTNPQVVLTGGPRIALTGTIAAGDYVEVDCATRTILLFTSGATVGVPRLNFYNAAVSRWYELPAGDTTLQMIADSFDGSAKLDVVFRSAYA